MEELQEINVEFKTHKDENAMLHLDNFEELKEILTLSKAACENLVVNDEINYRKAKKYRATINKTTKQITSLKTSYLKDYVYEYEMKSKELSAILKETAGIVDTKIKNYEKELGIAKGKIITVTFKIYQKELAEKLVAYGKELGIEGEIE